MADAFIANLPSKINLNCGVYRLINRKSGQFYVGSSKNLAGRKSNHFTAFRGSRNQKQLQEAYDAGAEFEFEILLNCEEESRHLWEQEFIDRMNPELNERKKVVKPLDHSDEVRAKLSAAKVGKNNPSKRPEVRAKMSGENSPTKRPEVRAKLSAAMKALGENSPMKSPEVRAKMSAVRKAYLSENPEARAKLSADRKAYLSANPDKNPMKSPEARAKISAARKAYWENRRRTSA